MKTDMGGNYRKDNYYLRIVRAVDKILLRSNVLAPVDVLIEIVNLSKQHYDAWRRGIDQRRLNDHRPKPMD